MATTIAEVLAMVRVEGDYSRSRRKEERKTVPFNRRIRVTVC